jgi:thiamine transport system ATP-binding protein
MSALDVEDVVVRFADTTALDGVSLSVAAGEVLAVVGPSGCGKSTLLRAIAGLEPLSGGRIRMDGRDLAGVPTHQRDLGLMFQDHALFPHLTVAENIGFGLEMRGASTQRVPELLDLVGLAGYGHRAIDALSGGEAQRVALARAVAPSPGLLMLDEPLGSLDRVLREQLTGDLRRLINELGLTALQVTHDQAEAFALADRMVVLRAGRIEQIGTPEDLWQQPASVFVAEFLGHRNLWPRPGGWVLVPVPSLRPGDDGEQTDGEHRHGLVEAVEFREGRFRVTARSTDDHPGESLVFDAPRRPAVDDAVRLVVADRIVVAD